MNQYNKRISGFYYDQQMASRMLTITLHPNTVKKKKADGTDDVDEEGAPQWDPVSDPDKGDFVYPDPVVTTDGKTINPWYYSKTPIATAILSDDFQVDISNNWSDFGGDPIGSLWNNYKSQAPYMRLFSNFAKDLQDGISNWKKNADANSKNKSENASWGDKLVSGLGKVAGLIGDSQEKGAKYLSRSLVVQGTRFSYYSGTGINMNNLVMKYTIFPNYDKDGKFMSVYDQISKILPYVVGDYIDIAQLKKETSEKDKYKLNEFAKWQLPPGGFEAEIRDVDVIQKGTLKLIFGPYFFIENLVILGFQPVFSKTMIKDPSKDDGDLTPMYCDVTITLKPASKYSINSFKRFISGEQNTEYVGKIAGEIKKSLTDEINYNKSLTKELSNLN
jgi:hypothetical protein